MTSKQAAPASSSAAGSGAAGSTAAASAAASSSSRRQPLRQARTQPRKLTNARSAVNGNSQTNESASHHPPARFYPALTSFTDAVDALPSETIRHFTLLREVDAKACTPEAHLRDLIDAFEKCPNSEDPYAPDPALEALNQLEEQVFAQTAEAAELLAQLEKEGTASGTIAGRPETKRARAAQIRSQLQQLLVTQDEKIHVVTTANEAIQKLLSRIEQTFAYVEVEIPALYRLGSKEHWAYKDPVSDATGVTGQVKDEC